jgi:hypothetical protein
LEWVWRWKKTTKHDDKRPRKRNPKKISTNSVADDRWKIKRKQSKRFAINLSKKAIRSWGRKEAGNKSKIGRER